MLTGKTGLILGVANKRSIAWAIAQATAKAGANLALAYQGERVQENVQELASTLGQKTLIAQCDVTNDSEIETLVSTLKEQFGTIDFLVHSVAYAMKEDLEGEFINTSRQGYHLAQDISSYSLTAVTRAVAPLMKENGGSVVTLTYLGGERVIPHYNVMGVAKAALEASVRYLAADLGQYNIRVNAVSAGPISTLAARGIGGFTKMLQYHRDTAPLRRTTEVSEVADTVLFLCSNMGRGITGETIYVDGGYHCMGMMPIS